MVANPTFLKAGVRSLEVVIRLNDHPLNHVPHSRVLMLDASPNQPALRGMVQVHPEPSSTHFLFPPSQMGLLSTHPPYFSKTAEQIFSTGTLLVFKKIQLHQKNQSTNPMLGMHQLGPRAIPDPDLRTVCSGLFGSVFRSFPPQQQGNLRNTDLVFSVPEDPHTFLRSAVGL